MMHMYLLDACVFIQAKKFYYSFETFPVFWKWLDREQDQGHIASIQMICDELLRGNDNLAEWARERKNSGWFLSNTEPELQELYSHIVDWVMNQPFNKSAKDDFLNVADPWLIAKAKMIGATVVTEEIYDPNTKWKVKIPNVCLAFDVPFITTFKLLHQRNAVFSHL